MTCPNCGKMSKYSNPKFCESCGASFAQQASPVQQSMQQMPSIQQTAAQPAKKRRRVKWWMIVLPILIAALAAGGIFYARTQKQYTEVELNIEDGWSIEITSFDENGNIIGYRYPDGTGTNRKLIKADAPSEVDVSKDKNVKGVRRVECLQWIFEFEDGDTRESDFLIRGYDKDDNLILEHVYSQSYDTGEWKTASITTAEYTSNGKLTHSKTENYDDGELYAVSETEFDRHGKMTKAKMVTADGALVRKIEYNQSYFLGLNTKTVLKQTTYMEWHYIDDKGGYVMLAKPYVTTVTQKHHYAFGLLTSTDSFLETDNPDAEEPTQEARIEYRYD